MRGPLIQQLHSLAVNVPCAVVTGGTISHLNRAFKQTFSIRRRLHYNVIKVCKKLQKTFPKKMTLAQCIDINVGLL